MLVRAAKRRDTELQVASTSGFAVMDSVVIVGGGNTEVLRVVGAGTVRAAVLVVGSGVTFAYPVGSMIYVSAEAVPDPTPTPAPTLSVIMDTFTSSFAPTPSPDSWDSLGVSRAGSSCKDCKAMADGRCGDEPLRWVCGKTVEECVDECLDQGEQCEYFAYDEAGNCILYETCTSFVQSEGESYTVFTIPLKTSFIPFFYR